MDSFTKELVSNASGELFPDNTLSSFTNFLTEQVFLAEQWGVAISEISYPSVYQNITEGYFKFFDEKLSKSTSTYNLEPGLYTSITDIVEAMNTLIQEKNKHNETCITVKVSRRTQKVVFMLANVSSGLAFCSTDLGHISGKNVGNHFLVLMKEKGPHEPLRPIRIEFYVSRVVSQSESRTHRQPIRIEYYVTRVLSQSESRTHRQPIRIQYYVTRVVNQSESSIRVVITSPESSGRLDDPSRLSAPVGSL